MLAHRRTRTPTPRAGLDGPRHQAPHRLSPARSSPARAPSRGLRPEAGGRGATPRPATKGCLKLETRRSGRGGRTRGKRATRPNSPPLTEGPIKMCFLPKRRGDPGGGEGAWKMEEQRDEARIRQKPGNGRGRALNRQRGRQAARRPKAESGRSHPVHHSHLSPVLWCGLASSSHRLRLFETRTLKSYDSSLP